MTQDDIEGWSALVDWFGHSPNFHDAEIVGVDLRRDPEPSKIYVHAWRTLSEVDENGFCRQDRHATVTFILSQISTLRVADWNHQNVLWELTISADGDGYTLHMPTSYGMEGEISAKVISVNLEPRSV